MILPYTIVFTTMSVDGKIASRTRYSRLSCNDDKIRQYWLRAQVDGVIVGANTVIVDNPTLRPKIFKHSRSKYYRIVIDGKLRVPVDARIFDTREYPTIVVTSNTSDPEKKNALRSKGVEILELERVPPLPMDEVLAELLNRYGIEIVMVEGGGELLWSLVEKRVVDEFRVTIAPYIVGGVNAVSLVQGLGFRDVFEFLRLKPKIVALCKCMKEVHIIYKVITKSHRPVKDFDIGTIDNFTFKFNIDTDAVHSSS